MAYVQDMGAWRPTSGAGSATNTAATAASIAAAQAPSSVPNESVLTGGIIAVALIGGAAYWYFKRKR